MKVRFCEIMFYKYITGATMDKILNLNLNFKYKLF